MEQKALKKRRRSGSAVARERRVSEDAEVRRTAPGGATSREKRGHLEELQAEPRRSGSAVTSRSSRRATALGSAVA